MGKRSLGVALLFLFILVVAASVLNVLGDGSAIEAQARAEALYLVGDYTCRTRPSAPVLPPAAD